MAIELFDISVPVSPMTVVWPRAPQPELERRLSIARGDAVNDSNLFMNVHTGTHIDAPLHHFAGGAASEAVSLAALIGEAWVLDMLEVPEIGPETLARAWPTAPPVRVLLKTKNSRLWADRGSRFVENYCGLTVAAAEWLLDRRINLVGIDYLSVQRFADPPTVHRLLLSAEVVLLEGLDLSMVAAGRYELLCLPLKLVGAEGAPARAVLRSMSQP